MRLHCARDRPLEGAGGGRRRAALAEVVNPLRIYVTPVGPIPCELSFRVSRFRPAPDIGVFKRMSEQAEPKAIQSAPSACFHSPSDNFCCAAPTYPQCTLVRARRNIQRRFICDLFGLGGRPPWVFEYHRPVNGKEDKQMRILGFPEFTSFVQVGWWTRRHRHCWRTRGRWHCRRRRTRY